MKRLLVILLGVFSLISVVTLDGFSQNKVRALMSFSPSNIEITVDNISKVYTKQVDIIGSIEIEEWELFCDLNIPGIPKERISFALGINPFDTSYTPFTSKIRLTRGGKNKSTFIPRLNIRYKPSWLDDPGVYQGSIVFSYRNVSNGKEELISLASLPITITIKPIFSVTVLSEPRRKTRKPQDTINITPNTLSFLVPYPGEWMSEEILTLEIKTNDKNWAVQCMATELIEYEESKKYKSRVIPPIPPNYLYVKAGDNNFLQLSNSYITILTGNKKGEFTVPLNFKIKTDESVLAGEYKGNIMFLFQGGN
ncbi:MAG: hypothetical protein N2380_08535 [bacterium]|nr:hypothetical protein [bacterium]